MERVAIAAAVRTPIGRRRGALADAHAGELLARLLAEAIPRSGVPAELVDQVLCGCVTQVGDQAYNVGRIAWLTAGLPETTAATTLDAQCGSSQQSVSLGASLIRAGAAEAVVACGVEVMSRHPLGSNVEPGPGHPMAERYRELYEVTTQGEAAERIADRWGVNRAECDRLGLRSQVLAAEAWAEGRFDDEVLPLAELQRDEGLRETTLEGLTGLTAAFREDGRHTAGNSSQISDGAAAVVLLAGSAAARLGIEPLGWIGDALAVGVDPVLKLTGPIPATRRIFERTGLRVDELRPLRSQRGVRERDRCLAAPDRRPARACQSERRRHRTRSSRRRCRRAALHDGSPRAPAARRRSRARDDVLRRRSRHGDGDRVVMIEESRREVQGLPRRGARGRLVRARGQRLDGRPRPGLQP